MSVHGKVKLIRALGWGDITQSGKMPAIAPVPNSNLPFPVTFRSLNQRNYRIWAGGAIVSNVGTWMQRVAQDWLVLTQLTHHSAAAVGIIMSLQFGPQFLLLPVTGFAADHFNRRWLLFATQAASGVLALILGLLSIGGMVQLWHVYLLAFLLGCVSAFDTPARQTFVSDLVGETDLPNAVALNSTSFNAARMIGPAIAGLVIEWTGCGWAFILNGLSYLAVLVSLLMLDASGLHPIDRPDAVNSRLLEGFHYVARHPNLQLALWMMFFISTFGINFPIFISTMDVDAFHADAQTYGILSSIMAVGSVAGALMAAHRSTPSIRLLAMAAAGFAISMCLAAIMPGLFSFGMVLMAVGISTQTFMTSTNSLIQLTTESAMRGRVIAILFAIAMGSTPLGAPLMGWIADQFGPRIAMFAGGTSGLFALLSVFVYRKHLKQA